MKTVSKKEEFLDLRMADLLARKDQAEALVREGIITPRAGKEMTTAVEKAINRIHKGDYGICGTCGNKISYTYLLKAPHAERCVECERALEN